MKKLIMLACALLLLAACGNNENAADTTPSPDVPPLENETYKPPPALFETENFVGVWGATIDVQGDTYYDVLELRPDGSARLVHLIYDTWLGRGWVIYFDSDMFDEPITWRIEGSYILLNDGWADPFRISANEQELYRTEEGDTFTRSDFTMADIDTMPLYRDSGIDE